MFSRVWLLPTTPLIECLQGLNRLVRARDELLALTRDTDPCRGLGRRIMAVARVVSVCVGEARVGLVTLALGV